MSCLDENTCSVNKENNLGYYRLHTIWKKDGFFINVTSKNGAWRGEMTPKDVSKMSVLLEMEPQSYLSQCREVLTCHGGRPGFVYAVENGCFTWKKVEDEDSGIKVKMGSVMLEPTNFVDTIQNLVTAALNCNKNLQERLEKISDEKEKVLESKRELVDKLNELIKTKETMENDLYSRFLLLINAKKKKIEELENLLEEEYKKQKGEKVKSSTDPYEIDTDIDSEGEIGKSGGKKMKRLAAKEETKRRSSRLRRGATKGKRVKKSEGDSFAEECDWGGWSNVNVKSTSPQPSTSKMELDNVGISKMELDNVGISKMESDNVGISKMKSDNVGISKMESDNADISKMESDNADISKMESDNVSISKMESESMKEEKQDTSLTKAMTKDELYDYFYGEL